MEEGCPSETLVYRYNITQCNNPEEQVPVIIVDRIVVEL
jgi:hypothetical protein